MAFGQAAETPLVRASRARPSYGRSGACKPPPLPGSLLFPIAEKGRRRPARHLLDVGDASAVGLDDLAADDALGTLAVLGALDEDIRAQKLEEVIGRVLVEDGDVVDERESREHADAAVLWDARAGRPLEPLHGGVRIDRDDEDVPEALRSIEDLMMAAMEEIEAAVRENDRPAGALGFGGDGRKLARRLELVRREMAIP